MQDTKSMNLAMGLAESLWIVQASPTLEDTSILVRINDCSIQDGGVHLEMYCYSCLGKEANSRHSQAKGL